MELKASQRWYFFMKAKAKMSKGVRKHIRLEKARIRRGILVQKEQQEAIKKLYEKFGVKIAGVDSPVANPS